MNAGERPRARRPALTRCPLCRLRLPPQIVEACPRAVLYKTLFKRRTALHLSAEAGSAECLLKVLWAAERVLGGASFQAYIDELDGRGNTALALACKHG